MEDILIVERHNDVCRIRSRGGRFDQTCPAEATALLQQLVPHGMMQEEFGGVWDQLEKTGRTEIEVSLPFPLSQL